MLQKSIKYTPETAPINILAKVFTGRLLEFCGLLKSVGSIQLKYLLVFITSGYRKLTPIYFSK